MSPELIDILGLISFVLGIIAIALGLVQFWEAKKQTKRLKLITDSLSTRYIGLFPDYLVTVTKLIDSATLELDILKGNPAPAYFSDQTIWFNYKQAIERKFHLGVSVNMICMSKDQRKVRLAQQFPSSKVEWKEWIKSNNSKLLHFLQIGHSEFRPDNLDYSKFLDLLLSTQTKMLKESFSEKGVKVLEIEQMIPIQVWIADRKKAVFSIQTLPTSTISHGFETSDPRFVDALYSMTKSLQKTNK